MFGIVRGMDLEGQVALVAGATRGGGRGIAVELGARGATVYVTGRSTRGHRSPMDRPETIEETAERVDAAGGRGLAVACDHTDPAAVRELVARLDRLDVLVNNVWGGDPLTQWGAPFWEHDLEDGLQMQRQAVWGHVITAHAAVPLMVARGSGLVVEVTDGVGDRYRESLFYDLAKASAIRLATAMDADLRGHGITVVAVSPGFLRSEAVLDHFGVTAGTWRDGIPKDRHFAQSETPHFVGRAVAALAADPDRERWAGRALGSWDLAHDYGFTDVDGARPDWGAYFATL
jgi:NAD(P)-dependent dehydrogenase (short-subunit alcohol dehydrogenase family)